MKWLIRCSVIMWSLVCLAEPVRLGLLTRETDWQGAVDLASVALAEMDGVEVLARDRLQALLGEWALKESGAMKPGELAAGRQLKADGMIRLSRKKEGETVRLILTVLDMRLGAVVGVEVFDAAEWKPDVIANLVEETAGRYLPLFRQPPESFVAVTLLPARWEEMRFDQASREREVSGMLYSALSGRPGLALLDRNHLQDHLFDLYFTEGSNGAFWGAALLVEPRVSPVKDNAGTYLFALHVRGKGRTPRVLSREGRWQEAGEILGELGNRLVGELKHQQSPRDPEHVRQEAARFSRLAVELQQIDVNRALYFAELAWSMGDVDPHMVSLLVTCRLQDAALIRREGIPVPLRGPPPDIPSFGLYLNGYGRRFPIRLRDGRVLQNPMDGYTYTLGGMVAVQDLLASRLDRLRQTKNGWLPIMVLNYNAAAFQQHLSDQPRLTGALRSLMRRNAAWIRETLPDMWASGFYYHKSGGYEMHRARTWYATTPDEYFDTFRAGDGVRRLNAFVLRDDLPALERLCRRENAGFPELPLAVDGVSDDQWVEARDRYLQECRKNPGWGQLLWLYLATRPEPMSFSAGEEAPALFTSALGAELSRCKPGEKEWTWLMDLGTDVASDERLEAMLLIWNAFVQETRQLKRDAQAGQTVKRRASALGSNWRWFRDMLLEQEEVDSILPQLEQSLADLDLADRDLRSLERHVKESLETLKKKQQPAPPRSPAELQTTQTYTLPPFQGRGNSKVRFQGAFSMHGPGDPAMVNRVWRYDALTKTLIGQDWFQLEDDLTVAVPYHAGSPEERLKVNVMTLKGCDGRYALFTSRFVSHLGRLFVLDMRSGEWTGFFREGDRMRGDPDGKRFYEGVSLPSQKYVVILEDRIVLGDEKHLVALPLNGATPWTVFSPEGPDATSYPNQPRKISAPFPWGTGDLVFVNTGVQRKTGAVNLTLSFFSCTDRSWSSRKEVLPGQANYWYQNKGSFVMVHPETRGKLLLGSAGQLDLHAQAFRLQPDLHRGEAKAAEDPPGALCFDLQGARGPEKWLLKRHGRFTRFVVQEGKVWLYKNEYPGSGHDRTYAETLPVPPQVLETFRR